MSDDLRHLCESPIERKFYDALLARLRAEFSELFDFYFGQDGLHDAYVDGRTRPGYEIHIAPQCEFAGLRLDFAILLKSGEDRDEFYERLIAIECDGHEWHERTKEQARRDRARDRLLARAGWVVQRFTGSEIFADADDCAAQIYELIMHDAVRHFVAQGVIEPPAAQESEVTAWIPTA